MSVGEPSFSRVDAEPKRQSSVNEFAAGGGLLVTLSVANTGGVAGTEVVQVYCIDPVTDYVRPWKRLLAFTRVPLQPGAAALRLRAAPAGLRTRVAMEAAPAQCALISLSGDDPLRVAQVLKKAWMEGGVKRGLKGSVLVGAPAGFQSAPPAPR